MPILGVVDSGKLKSANSYESIATTTVGSGGSGTITFSSIPSTYQHLQIRILARGNQAAVSDSFIVRFNGDSGSNYTLRRLFGDGATVGSDSIAPYTAVRGIEITGNTAAANIFGISTVDIIDYSSTVKYKTTKVLGGYDRNGAGWAGLVSGIWTNTSAITDITITPVFGTLFSQYSSFALYGIKGQQMAAGSTYEPIATNTLGTAVSTVTFSSIPSTYTDLVLVTNSFGTGVNFQIQVNGDTATNYSRTRLGGNGTTISSARSTSATSITINDLSSTVREISILQFHNYSNTTTFKSMLGRAGLSSVSASTMVALWRSTSAITSIALNTASNTFAIGSTFTLYGITAA